MEIGSEDYFDKKSDILQIRINSFLRRKNDGGLIDKAIKDLIASTLKEVFRDIKEISSV